MAGAKQQNRGNQKGAALVAILQHQIVITLNILILLNGTIFAKKDLRKQHPALCQNK